MADHRHTSGTGYVAGCPGCQEAARTQNKRRPRRNRKRTEQDARASRRRTWVRAGMDPDEAEAMWLAGGGCRICGRTDQRMTVDHDHGTGQVRGLLCHSCNVAIGLLGDDPTRLRAAITYLEATSGAGTSRQPSPQGLHTPTA